MKETARLAARIAGTAPAEPAVLVLEDDPGMMEVLRQLLQWQGYPVLAAHSLEEALSRERAYAGQIPLILSDVMLGSDHGPEAVRQIRRRRSHVTALFMSGYVPEACLKPGDMEAGDSFILKPFNLSEMLAKVQSAMARHLSQA